MSGLKFYRKEIPEDVHPAVKFMFEQINAQQTSYKELQRKSGVDEAAMRKWGNRSHPRINNLEAVLNALGYTLIVIRKQK